ncbi:hypothetical protein AA23498_0907 [Acetobacter nitrogenifigens DSM 23921 = NBRC 105050]|uniref:Type VI secretion-associated protein n=1 Tax=Acetobacter nitrogenifigens DSM 23921 = NBRC 105050 TaxID=1120919 RepID=A0A511XBS9_9PROT|nr:type VI secretion system-associated protein TagF [Acetobacter nitrogenifigens]GBQ90540.1 hypothetical protein AA23498_0907 [Acetobacter nitrogenifigens DSM 23921 = NBRC 105050]GEN60321.1 hypothetical protein ANI02nite_22050 [Acetobacter nitrogenifigens DSM 23921 = NBRC 105050]
MIAPYVGYYGKLPSRGDFLRGGLPDDMNDRLHDWITHQIAGSRERLGDAFEEVWHAAPFWHFTITSGRLSPNCAVTGVWAPSVDKVGRCFPFVLAIVHDPRDVLYRALAPFSDVVRDAIASGKDPDVVDQEITRLCGYPWPSAPPERDIWWLETHSGPQVTLRCALPVDQAFDWLLTTPDRGRGS